ncbi:MAG TPA: hypothetical protein ENK60_04135 [Anaerolineae bacterium]|nr:hypothetical protein [Anaerolineae bacterium]
MSANPRHPGYESGGYGRTLLLLVLIFVVATLAFIAAVEGEFTASKVTAFPVNTATFKEPVIQIDPVGDWKAYKAQQEELLNSYGWVDKDAGIARIPIERAIELTAQQGLPHR